MGWCQQSGQAKESQVNGSLLDTHYWLWLQTGNVDRLPPTARDELLSLQRSRSLYLSDVSVWELARLIADDHMNVGMSVDQFLNETTTQGGLQLLSLTSKILIESTRLPGDIHRDPSDRILIATAREHGLTLITRDKDILKYAARGHLNARKP